MGDINSSSVYTHIQLCVHNNKYNNLSGERLLQLFVNSRQGQKVLICDEGIDNTVCVGASIKKVTKFVYRLQLFIQETGISGYTCRAS